MSEEYTVELCKNTDDLLESSWIRQERVTDSYEECVQWCEENPVDEPYYYSIWCIEYDENENEVKSYPVY